MKEATEINLPRMCETYYNVISAREKQATRSGICFSALINEQADCEAV